MAHLNSAEGIQNMCATQIMTKSKSLRAGFSSQVAYRPGAHLMFPKCITNCLRKLFYYDNWYMFNKMYLCLLTVYSVKHEF